MACKSLHVRSGVAGLLADVSQYARQPDAGVVLSMDAWARYYVAETNLDQLLARDDVNASNRDFRIRETSCEHICKELQA